MIIELVHHQPESHQQCFNQTVSDTETQIETPGPIEQTPDIPESGKKMNLWLSPLVTGPSPRDASASKK